MSDNFHPTALDAVNEALIKLGEDVTLDVLSKTADETVINAAVSRKAAHIYDAARKQVLTEHAWSFATCIRQVVSQINAAGEFETQIPGGLLQIQACYDAGGNKPETIHSAGVVYSNAPLARIAFSRDIEDLGLWPHQVRAVLVARLAADLAKIVTGRQIDLQTYEQSYQQLIETAKVWDARQNNLQRKPYGRNYIVDRMRGGCPVW